MHQLPLCDFARATFSEIFADRTAPTLSPPVAARLPVSENFDGIGTSATATLPTDSKADKNDTTVRSVGTYAAAGTATERVGGASLASNASAGIYNFGSGTTTTGSDRAVGFLSTGSVTKSGNLYMQLANNSGTNYSGLKISYDVEKYRNGSNPAGYSMQMYYSTDGSTWTSAGANFLTSFSADADNSGFSPAPGATTSVTNKILSQTVNNGSNFYLAWNYSVTSGTTTTNAQALAIDKISIQGTNTISGTLFDSGGSPITTGRTIKLIKNGSITGTAITNGSGVYSISGLILASGDRIGVFIDGATEKGATVTLSGTSDITNFDITQNRVSVRTDNGGSPAITNSNLADLDSSKDSDIPFTVSSGTLSVNGGVELLINFGCSFASGGDINAGGSWTNNGTFTAGSFTVTLNGTSNQTIGGVSNSFFNTLTINNSGTSPNNVVKLEMNTNVGNVLNVSGGVFDQNIGGNSSSLVTAGNAPNVVVVAPGATWRNLGTGDVTLSSGVLNAGQIVFNANGTPCGENDDIQIRSSVNGTQRTWSGTGTFSMTDVDVQDQKVPGGLSRPLQIIVNSGTGAAANNTGWTFTNTCTGPFTWIGGANQDWQAPTNWSPIRATAATTTTTDVLIFDGNVTPGPTLTNVPTQENAAMRLTNGVNAVTLKASGTNTLTLSGGTGTDLDVPGGTVLALADANGLTISLTRSGHQATIGGQVIFQDGPHRLIGSNAGEITMTGTNAFTATAGFTGNPFGSGTNGSVVFDTGSSGFFNAGDDPFGGDGHSVVVFNLNSTATFNASSALSCSNPALSQGRSYGNLVLDDLSGGSTSYSCSGAFPLTVANNLTIQSGRTFTLSGSTGGNLILDGNLTDNGTFDPNNRTVEFRGGGATQTISKSSGAESFFDVFISLTAGGSVKLLSPVTIASQLNLNTADSVLELNSKTLTLNGTVIGTGGLKGDLTGSSLVVGGTGALGTLSFVSGSRLLSAMTMARTSSGSVTLGNDLLIGGGLALTDGVVNMGSNTLTLNGSVSRTNGYIIGNEQRNFSCSTNCSFTWDVGTSNGYSPVEAAFTVSQSGTYGLTVKAVGTKHPSISGTNALKRYWSLTNPSGPGTISTDLIFHYLDPTDIPVTATEANFVIFKYDGSFSQPGGSVNADANTATINGLTSFSDWTLAEPGSVFPVLGNYNDASVSLGGNATLTTDAAPTNTTSITAETSANFMGAFAVDLATGVVTVTDAHPAGTYLTTVTANNSSSSSTKTFTLTVANTAASCGALLYKNKPDIGGLSYPQSQAVGDFNGDGKQDIVIANSGGYVAVRMGDGSGGFTTKPDVGISTYPIRVALGDFNGDGKQDLAVIAVNAAQNGSIVAIRLGDGTGGFAISRPDVSMGSFPLGLVVGDFNGDGREDLAATNNGDSTVSIRLGDGAGNFTGSTAVSVGSSPVAIVVGDFNNDGKTDLATANATNPGTVSILKGDGAGNFTVTSFTVGNLPQSITVGDFNNDGNQDFATGDFNDNAVSIRLGDGSGAAFTAKPSIPLAGRALHLVSGDFNNDGNQDIAVGNAYTSGTVSIRYGAGDGTFSGTTELPTAGTPNDYPSALVIGDFNQDARLDLAFANPNSSIQAVLVRLNSCPGQIQFALANTDTPEGNSPDTQTVNIAVKRVGGSEGPVTINYLVADDTATTTDSDYSVGSATGMLSWANGDTADKLITVTVNGDDKFETAEKVNLSLNTSGGGAVLGSPIAATLTITNDDSQPTATIGNVTQTEGSSGPNDFTFTVTLSNPSASDVTINYSTHVGTATAGDDYTAISNGSLTIPATQTSGTFNVSVNGDTTYEADETFTVKLDSATGATIGSPSTGTGTIQNDDAPPATLIVNTTADHDDGFCLGLSSGDCTLREAINAANFDNSDLNTIAFDIPATDSRHFYYANNNVGGVALANITPTTATGDSSLTGVIDPDYPHSWWSILPTSALPSINGPVMIDGYSQLPCASNPSPCSQANDDPTGDNAQFSIELNGSTAGANVHGLVTTGGASTIQGLAINRFTGNGLGLFSDGNTISGNFIGADVSGTLAAANHAGILINNSATNEIGCTTADMRNVISGNTDEGIEIYGMGPNFNATLNFVQGNFIGTDRTGLVALGNGGDGVKIYGGFGNTVGVDSSSMAASGGNVISRNGSHGIEIATGPGCVMTSTQPGNFVQGNFIGTDLGGTLNLGNTRNGVAIYDAALNVIGGVTSPLGNVIANNGGTGVLVEQVGIGPNPITGNSIRGNSIHDNSALGIDLAIGIALGTGDGVTSNDPGDGDPGPDKLQNFPEQMSATASGGSGTISGTLDSNGPTPFKIDFYVNSSCNAVAPNDYGEGRTYLGTTTLNSAGSFTSDPMALNPGDIITATATDADGNTSEFSQCFTVGSTCPTITIDPSSLPNGVQDVPYAQTITASGGSGSYSFSAGSGLPDGLSLPTSGVLNGTPSMTGTFTFTVTATDTSNNCTGTRDYTVNISPCPGSLTVNDIGDDDDASPGDGVCATAASVCTLRAAIQEANALNSCGPIDINFSIGSSTITLGSPLTIDHHVRVNGPTADSVVISGNGVTRAFTCNSGKIASISNLTISGGNGSGGDGGAIQNNGTLTLAGVTLSGNSALDGGAIRNDGSLVLINTTISGNNATVDGGGLYSAIGTAALTNITVTNNRADNDSNNSGTGGGVFVVSGNVLLHNTIVALNFKGGSGTTPHDIAGALDASSSYNLIGDGSGITNVGSLPANNQIGTSGSPIDPLLGALMNNGGPTFTHGLLYNSPAVDSGDNAVTGSPLLLTTDQRGSGFSRQADGDLVPGPVVDIGACERQATETRNVPNGQNVNVDLNDARLGFPCVPNGGCGGFGTKPDAAQRDKNTVTPANGGSPTVSITVIDPNPPAQPTPPSGYIVGNSASPPLPAFDISSTSLSNDPPVTICFYLPSINDQTFFNGLKVFHREAGTNNTYGDGDDVLVDRTRTTNPTDFPNRLVCGEVSSFSAFVIGHTATPTAANGNVSGQIVDDHGKPVEGVAVRLGGTQNRLTITDVQGNYHFDNVETNGFYVVTPSRANFTFSPSQRSFSALGQHTHATFSATSAGNALNPLDVTEYFVRQQYLDFLGREPDEAGFSFWVNNIESCGADQNCRAVKRIDTSAAFFLSIEFQQTGYLVYRTYQAAYGDLPDAPVPIKLSEFKPDTEEISNGVVVLKSGWETVLENNKKAFAAEFVQRSRFTAAYPTTMTPAEFVDKLFTNTGVRPSDSDRATAINEFGPATTSADPSARGRALRRVAENSSLARQDFNQAFVLMQYFGYLRRDANTGPDTDFTGFSFWLDKLDRFNGTFQNAEMVKAFLTSIEYRGRFPR